MAKRTYEGNAKFIDEANDLDSYIVDKRINWRASPQKKRFEEIEDIKKIDKSYTYAAKVIL